MGRDPAGLVDGPNLYAFVRNGPTYLLDPFGEASEVVMITWTEGLAAQTGATLVSRSLFIALAPGTALLSAYYMVAVPMDLFIKMAASEASGNPEFITSMAGPIAVTTITPDLGFAPKPDPNPFSTGMAAPVAVTTITPGYDLTRVEMGQGKGRGNPGERNWQGESDNPWKGWSVDPTNPKRVRFRDKQTGKWVYKPRPPDFPDPKPKPAPKRPDPTPEPPAPNPPTPKPPEPPAPKPPSPEPPVP